MSLTNEMKFSDEWLLDLPMLTDFVEMVNKIRLTAQNPREAVAKIRPHFKTLLAEKSWLPDSFQGVSDNAGMGRQTGMWLIYRSGDGGLAFSALVLPPWQKNTCSQSPGMGFGWSLQRGAGRAGFCSEG